jgi:hypothetical protein
MMAGRGSSPQWNTFHFIAIYGKFIDQMSDEEMQAEPVFDEFIMAKVG